MVKLTCREVTAEVSSDPVGSSEAGMALQKCPRSRQGHWVLQSLHRPVTAGRQPMGRSMFLSRDGSWGGGQFPLRDLSVNLEQQDISRNWGMGTSTLKGIRVEYHMILGGISPSIVAVLSLVSLSALDPPEYTCHLGYILDYQCLLWRHTHICHLTASWVSLGLEYWQSVMCWVMVVVVQCFKNYVFTDLELW